MTATIVEARRPRTAALPPPEAVWLFAVAGLVAAMILIGGATRLTDSGLSITEWNFAKGVVPPLSAQAWEAEFALYRQTAEYQIQNRGMGLAEFQFIYWWEWGHRFFGKLIGLVFAAGYFGFLATGRLRGIVGPATALFALGGLQGYVGWWMVESGLAGRLDVAPYRLATHLGLAFAIFALALGLGLRRAGWGRAGSATGAPSWAPAALLGVLYLQILSGALVAGADAGKAYADWPTMGGRWFPSGYGFLEPFWRNLLENPAALQFNHRMLGYLAAGGALWVAACAWGRGTGPARSVGLAVGVVALWQAGLGIATVMAGAPLNLSLAHQGTAIVLWGLATALVLANGNRLPKPKAQALQGD